MDVTVPTTIGTSTLTRASTASYYDSAGVLRYSPINTVRLNYNPANLSAPPTVLMEAAGSGLDNAVGGVPTEGFYNFTKNNSTIYLNAATAPDGTNTAALLVESSSTGVHNIQRGATAASIGGPSTLTIYAKAKERTSLILKVQNSTTIIQSVIFNLSTLTTTNLDVTPFAATGSIVAINNGWYRCVVRNINIGATTISVELYNGAENYSGDGVSGMYLWGLGFENGIETSYIPSIPTYSSGGANASYYNSNGRLVFSSGASRTSYTPGNLTLMPKLLFEDNGTNLLINSNAFSTSPWTSTAGVGAATSAAPTVGNNTGTLLTDNNSGALLSLTQSITVPSDTVMRVFSIYILKTTAATSFPGIEVTYSGATPRTGYLTLNTDTGAFALGGVPGGANSPDYARVQSLPTFWRVSVGVAGVGSGNNTLTVRIYPAVNNDASINWTATQVGSIVIYGAQLEVGFTETSYIATGASTVTRTADVVTTSAGTRAADVPSFGLIYTSIPENDFPVYNSTATYGIDVAGSNSVIYNHIKYASLQASNMGHQPDISPTWWSVIGATNAYAMFDSQVGTQTVGTVGGHIITYVKIGGLTSLNFINVSADTITVQVYSGYTLMSTNVIDFTGGSTGVPVTDYSLTGMTAYSDAYVVIDAYSATKAPAIGNFVVGTNYYVGSTETSPTISITDYSVKTIDAFGNPTLTKRGYAKRMNTKQLLDDNSVDVAARLMASIRATPCVWNANTTLTNRTSNNKTSLIVYGYYKDWEIDCAYTTKSYLTCQIEGLL